MEKGIRNIEKKFYELIGVNLFRKYVLLNIGKIYKFFHIDVYSLESTNIDSLKKYAKHNCIQFSLGHIALLAAFGIMQYDNIPVIMLNVYCILVQRYNFIRIQECLERYDRLIELRINRIVSEVTECEESPVVTKQTSKLDQLEKQKETLLDAKEILLREKESIEATCTQTEEKQQSI